MFTSHPIGFVSSPYNASEVPNGLGAKHEADGVLKILPEFELGLTHITVRHVRRSRSFRCRGHAMG
jgi:tRNA (Thr-GGU) A37 N-methylase